MIRLESKLLRANQILTANSLAEELVSETGLGAVQPGKHDIWARVNFVKSYIIIDMEYKTRDREHFECFVGCNPANLADPEIFDAVSDWLAARGFVEEENPDDGPPGDPHGNHFALRK